MTYQVFMNASSVGLQIATVSDVDAYVLTSVSFANPIAVISLIKRTSHNKIFSFSTSNEHLPKKFSSDHVS